MPSLDLSGLRGSQAYRHVLANLGEEQPQAALALQRAARLPVLASLYADMQQPILLLTDRADRALTLLDELGFWAPDAPRFLFPEPNPLFYEHAAWGSSVRRDRLQAITALAIYSMPGIPKPERAPILVTSARALMTRTLPRRDLIKVTRSIQIGQAVAPDTLIHQWTEIGYQPTEIVLEPGQFSRRGGILDIWPPAEALPARLDFFGDEIDTLRTFDPATQRTVQKLEKLLITPAREVLPGYAARLDPENTDVDEFSLPLVHPAVASLLDYLPKRSLTLVDDLELLRDTVTEFEEQAVKLRDESQQEGVLPQNFPIPYLSWSELYDSLSGHTWLELGRSTAEEPSPLAEEFTPGPRFGGRLKFLVNDLAKAAEQIGRAHV
jgi:transcription-repair coupling factor (superfamily II helicase)